MQTIRVVIHQLASLADHFAVIRWRFFTLYMRIYHRLLVPPTPACERFALTGV